MQTIKVNCDLCNKELSPNELDMKKVLLGLGGEKPKSKNSILFVFEGQERKGELCFSCARKVRDKLEDIKEKK